MGEERSGYEAKKSGSEAIGEQRNGYAGNFSYKPGRLISMIWQARKHFFVLLIILLVMKVVLIHHAGSSAKLLSLTLKILIGYVVKKGPN